LVNLASLALFGVEAGHGSVEGRAVAIAPVTRQRRVPFPLDPHQAKPIG
jgi:hypothetical protein